MSREYEAEARALATAIYADAEIAEPIPPIRVSDVRCGRYYWKPRHRITLPAWLWDENHRDVPRYLEWYVAHELAHGLSGCHGHQLAFQLVLHRLAPIAWHWESTYQPKRYAEACAVVYGYSP